MTDTLNIVRNIARVFTKGLLTGLTLMLVVFTSTAQTNDAGFITKQFNKYKDELLHEKLFVHTDRSFYVAGEIVWFKLYCIDEGSSKLTDLSKVAYVEVLNKDQQPVLQAKIALQNGTGNGSLLLPSTLPSGNYTFRSYTNWMKNFDAEFYFHQDLTIINTLQTDTLSDHESPANFDVQFFPEGGEMVNELAGKVAFHVTDNAGKGIDFNGVIADENNDTILRFKPTKFGIGSFTFTPKNNHQYKAFITTSKGQALTQNLPPALAKGFAMNVSQTGTEGLKINIHTNTDSKFIYVFIHTRQQVAAAQLLYFTNGNASFEIDKNKLGEGISHITLFDYNDEPVAERLYFNRPQQQLLIDAKTNAAEYLPRKKVTIDLLAKDAASNPQSADLSIAVFHVDSVPFSYKDIYSYLWMTSDLKGKIESPEYYLNNTSTEANEALDNLMLTHGWRKFKWADVLQDKKPALTFLPEYEGHIVSGKVVQRVNESPAANMQAFLSVPGPHFKLYNSISNSNGSVNFNTKDLYGNRLMVALVNTPDSAAYRIDLSNPFSESFSTEKVAPFTSVKLSPSQLLKQSVNMQVQNVYAGNKLNVFDPLKIDTSNFYGTPDTKYMLDDYTRFPTMEEVLVEYVPEISVRKRDNKVVLRMLTRDEAANPITKDPVMLLDGIPQFDRGNKIARQNPLKVERLETIKSTYFLGTARFDGIASFFTYKGDLEGFQLDSSSTVLDYEALQLRRAFYTPVYETPEQFSSRLPDYRNLMYWSPDIKTDAHGTKQISFYTSDLSGKYAVVVQGISAQGKTGTKVLMIDVKKEPLP